VRRAAFAAAVRLEGKPALQKHPLFLDGSFEVQDEGSQLLAFLVAAAARRNGGRFLCRCRWQDAAAGRADASSGRLYAFDVSDKRLSKLKPRMARSGLSNIHPVVIASENDPRVKRLAGKIDRVLVDAPCSGLGTLRRNPDLKWRQTPRPWPN
jgi:16S rRNA (cytosine967-C5)-methyltransferase